jgi:hypothetical protein
LYGNLASAAGGAVRQLYAGNERLFAVAGTHFYEVNPASFAVIKDYGSMAGSTGVGPAQIVVCGTGVTAQLLVMDSSVGKIFYADPITPAMVDVYNGFSLEYLDTFCFALAGSADNVVAQSATLDGATWPGLTTVTVEGTVDKKTRLIVVNSLMWIMGQDNIEVWYNAGTAGFTLARMPNGTINQGIYGGYGQLAAFTAVRIQNTVLWMGQSTERGYGQFWMANGLTPVRISTPAVEALLKSYGDISKATSFAEEYDGHSFFVTNFPNANSGNGATLVYDLVTNEWHERTHDYSGTQGMALPNCFASVDIGGTMKNFVGGPSGNIYLQDSSYTSDAGTAIKYVRRAPHVQNSQKWVKHQKLLLDGSWGAATPTLAWSDNSNTSLSFNTPRNIQTLSSEAANGFMKSGWMQLGRGLDRVYEVAISTSADQVRLSNAYLSVEGGNDA